MKKILGLLCIFLLIPISAFSQYYVQGKVTDEK